MLSADHIIPILKQANNPKFKYTNSALLGIMIRDYRETHDLEQKEFAKLVGCSTGTICRLESGKQRATYPITIAILTTISKEIADALTLILINIEFKNK